MLLVAASGAPNMGPQVDHGSSFFPLNQIPASKNAWVKVILIN